MSDRDDIQELIKIHYRHLQKLKEQRASYRLATPPFILIEIEDIETELEKLQAKLKEIKIRESTTSFDTARLSEPSLLSRVCFISSEYPPYEFGLGAYVEKLTTALGDNVDVDVVLPHYKDKYNTRSASRVKLQPLATVEAWYDDPTSWLRFARHAVDKIVRLDPPPQVIHCHDWVTALAGIICRWKLKIPLLFHLHLSNNYPLCASVENLGLVCADLVMVGSEAMREIVNDRPFKIRRDVEVVNKGVDVDAFRPSQDWPADDGYILFVGRLKDAQREDMEYLLRAFSFVREEFPNISFKVVEDGAHRSWLEELCRNLMITRNVEFLGWQKEETLIKLYQMAQIIVIPADFGMTALEAMACQRPVVASRVGGLKEIVDHGNTGFLAEPKDDLDLAQWLMTLLANPELRHKMGEAGRVRAFSPNYTWSTIVQSILSLYDSLLEESPLDMNIPTEANEYIKQIKEVSQKMSPLVTDKLLDDLFSWRFRS